MLFLEDQQTWQECLFLTLQLNIVLETKTTAVRLEK